jgi:hypothetical protein
MMSLEALEMVLQRHRERAREVCYSLQIAAVGGMGSHAGGEARQEAQVSSSVCVCVSSS